MIQKFCHVCIFRPSPNSATYDNGPMTLFTFTYFLFNASHREFTPGDNICKIIPITSLTAATSVRIISVGSGEKTGDFALLRNTTFDYSCGNSMDSSRPNNGHICCVFLLKMNKRKIALKSTEKLYL